jgi:hypothetical protein
MSLNIILVSLFDIQGLVYLAEFLEYQQKCCSLLVTYIPVFFQFSVVIYRMYPISYLFYSTTFSMRLLASMKPTYATNLTMLSV